MAIAQALLGFAYPLLILLALLWLEARQVALLVLGVFALRFVLMRFAPLRTVETSRTKEPGATPAIDRGQASMAGAVKALWAPAAAIGLVLVGTAIWNDPVGLFLAPVLINVALFTTFAFSLRGEPMVERFARLQVGLLSDAEVVYCRSVTIVWCFFFVANAGVALVLALTRRVELWALYTGLVSYLLIGMLFASEYVYRHYRFRRYVGGFADPLLRRFFPPASGDGIGHRAEGAGASSPSTGEPRLLPETLSVDGDDRVRRVTWRVPHELACWPGHFPGEEILPGVMQLDWVMREIESWKGARPLPGRVEALKFKHPVRPGDRLTLTLEEHGAAQAVSFTLSRSERRVASGRCVPASADEAPIAAPDAPARSDVEADWPTIAELLPHSGAMVWLRRVESHSETRTRCAVDVADLGLFCEASGEAPAWIALEWMAQCVAVHAGLVRSARGERPCLGLLLGSRRVVLSRSTYTRGQPFSVVAERIWGRDRGLASFDCRVEDRERGTLVAEARLSCFVPEPGQSLPPAD